MESREESEKAALEELQKQVDEAIERWRHSKDPAWSRSRVAQHLGLKSDSTLSKNTGRSRGGLSRDFVIRVATRIPQMAWVRDRYIAITSGASLDDDDMKTRLQASQRRADLYRRIDEFEREASAAIKQIADAAREALDE